jgi:hypothetical protein
MSPVREAVAVTGPQLNSLARIQVRVASGRIGWTGPLLLLVARPVLWMTTQCLVALLFLLLHHRTPWREATYWWSVYFTVGDIGCLIGLRYFTRQEGTRQERTRLRDLIGPIHLRHGRDLFLGAAYFLLFFFFFMAGGYLSQQWFYGSSGVNPSAYILHARALPPWAMAYSITVWWLVSSPTEEMTYQAFVLPRLQALTGRTWVAFAAVAFWWTAQHCVLGFVPDARSLTCRFLGFLPGCMMSIALYLRTRRLMPLILAHWPMDIAAVLMTAF